MKGGEGGFQERKKREKRRKGGGEDDGQMMVKTMQLRELMCYFFEKNRIAV